jgi:hypothetical protein
MEDYSIQEDVHPKGSFDNPESLVGYLFDLKAGAKGSWTASKPIPSSDATRHESQISRPATLGTRCLSGVSTPREVEGTELATGTDLQRDAAQPVQSSDPTYTERSQRPRSGRKSPTHYHYVHRPPHLRQQPTGSRHDPVVSYQSDHQPAPDKTQNATQGGRPYFDCTHSFQHGVSSGVRRSEQQRHPAKGFEGLSELDRATEHWRRRYVAKQKVKDARSDASGNASGNASGKRS